MTLGLVALFLPRMELGHLAEWIAYHQAVGVSRFYLYDNGPLSRDAVFGDGEGERVWSKKPQADFRLELSDEEVDRQVRDILAEFGDAVTHVPWESGGAHGATFRQCQRSAINGELARQQQLRDVDWLGHLDIDELLVAPQGSVLDLLHGLDGDIAAVRLNQKLLESRWREGQGVPYAQLSRSYGVLRFNRKFLLRVRSAAGWKSPHQILRTAGKTWQAPADVLRFHHFRGTEHAAGSAPTGWGIERYRALALAGVERDETHQRFQRGGEGTRDESGIRG
jgi:hypothetical protein